MNKLVIKIWDVQHGSAAYVGLPDGKHMVIDLGTGDVSGDTSLPYQTFSPLSYLAQNYGIRQLEHVIITHPHKDHIDDIGNFDRLRPLMLTAPRMIPEEAIRKGNRQGNSPKIDTYMELLNRYSGAVPVSQSPTLPVNSGGVNVEIFQPRTCATSNLNDQSLVVFLTYAGSTICIPGDNEKASWTELLGDPAFINALRKTDIFVASHHGRASGYCDDVFDYCKPYLVIVSDGPQGDTCVADKYRTKVKGWKVHSRSKGTHQSRYVLTTRSDGSVQIEFYEDSTTHYMYVVIE